MATMYSVRYDETERRWAVLVAGEQVDLGFQFYVSEPALGRLAVHTVNRPLPIAVVGQSARNELSEIIGDAWKLDGQPVGELDELVLTHDGRILAERK